MGFTFFMMTALVGAADFFLNIFFLMHCHNINGVLSSVQKIGGYICPSRPFPPPPFPS